MQENVLPHGLDTLLTGVAVAIGLVALLVLALVLLRGRRSSQAFPVVARKLMTRSETEFFRKLVAACSQIGGLHVCPQVCMGAVMEPDRHLDAQTRMSVRNRFGSKIIDFVLMDGDGAVRLLVELDDPSHRGREEGDARRDSMTAAAGLRTLRIPDGRRTSTQSLVGLLGDALTR